MRPIQDCSLLFILVTPILRLAEASHTGTFGLSHLGAHVRWLNRNIDHTKDMSTCTRAILRVLRPSGSSMCTYSHVAVLAPEMI